MTEEDFKRCFRLFRCSTIEDCLDFIDIYSNFLFTVIRRHQHDKVISMADAKAKIILQMMFTKLQHLKGIISGIHYTSPDQIELSGIIDPIVVGAHIRTTFEMVGMFNLIYTSTRSTDEKEILYSLWAHAGLSYRQRFEEAVKNEENKIKAEEEKEQMNTLVQNIQSTLLYKNLSMENQEKILHKLKSRDYLIRFDGVEVKFLSWQNLTEVMGVKKNILSNMYTYFSLYSHPSNVAVFQFAEMFEKGNEAFERITVFNVNTQFILTSIFIADYIKIFPQVLETFNQINLVDQIVINFQNHLARGEKYSINDALQQLQPN